MKFTESKLEEAIIELFEEKGFKHTKGEDIDRDLEEVLIKTDLQNYLFSKYSDDGITKEEVEKIINNLVNLPASNLYETNRTIMRFFSDGFLFKRDNPTKKDLYIQLISPIINKYHFGDEDKNIYRIVSQLEIKGIELRKPDWLYLNGIPIVVLEFKSAIRENATIFDAFTQITTRYKRGIPALFKFNTLSVISDGVNNRMGSFSPYEFYFS